MKHFYYLHESGDIIGKTPSVVDSDPQYFDSSFVRKVWLIDTENRSDAWKVVLEALALEADLVRVSELVEKWKLTYEDSIEMLKRTQPTLLMREGMEKFIVEFLKMEEKDYWQKIALQGNNASNNIDMMR
ncbi:MAG: hypothetical protein DDT22_00331 [candidate division WS2 bacterium]|nr:hypothetical protein [Bacillota bacterium]MBT9174670.1 hypothetical protein [Candidatus Lithacetigena glycinireducens]